MDKIRICDLVCNSVWYDPRVIKQIDEYYNNGFDLYVIGVEDDRYKEDEINKLKGSVKIIKLKDRLRKRKNIFNTILKKIYYLRSIICSIVKCSPDIIHANDLNALLPAYIASKKLKCIVVYDSHEIFTENIGIVSSWIRRTYWRIVERAIIKNVDLVVSVSNAAAEYLSNLYNIPKPLVVTNCSKKPIIDNTVIKSDKFEVLNHGQFYEGRGYEIMVEAAKITDNYDISYVLRGFGRLENSLKQMVIDNNLNNVKFDPPVKTTELVSYARRSSVGIAITLPMNINFRLTISNKIFEYLAAGLPVIMSDIPEHRYLNEKYNFGIVLNENTAEALKDAVLLLYYNRELYEEYSKNAIKASNELNWESEFKKLIDIELKLLYNI